MGAIGEVCIALAGVPACVPSSMSGEGTTSVSMSGIMPAMARGVPSCVVLILVARLYIQEQSVEIYMYLASDKHVRVLSVTLGKHKSEGTTSKCAVKRARARVAWERT